MDKRKITLVIVAVLLVILLGLCVPKVSAKDVCWIENYLETDFTVCEVENGIYILTPTPTPTQKLDTVLSGYPAPKDGEVCSFWNWFTKCNPFSGTIISAITPIPPRPTPTFAPTMVVP